MILVLAFVMMKIGTGEMLNWTRVIKEKIAQIDGVKEVHAIFGRFDLIAKVEAETSDGISTIVTDKIQSIEGIQSTETFIVHP